MPPPPLCTTLNKHQASLDVGPLLDRLLLICRLVFFMASRDGLSRLNYEIEGSRLASDSFDFYASFGRYNNQYRFMACCRASLVPQTGGGACPPSLCFFPSSKLCCPPSEGPFCLKYKQKREE